MQIISAIIRGLQLIFAVVVLGISVDLARGQNTDYEAVPAATGYAGFTGGLGIVVALVGAASLFVSSLEGIITLALDGLSGLAFLAGGIAYAVLLKGTECGHIWTTWDNVLISGGCGFLGDEKYCYSGVDKNKSRCTSAKANDAFMFISFVVCAGSVAYSIFARNKSGGVTYA